MIRKVLGYGLLAIIVAIGGLVLVASRKPDSFRYQHTASIKAPPEKIFAIVNDPRNWPKWSPWQKLDPNQKATYSGAATGKGAITEFSGNSEVGAGRTEITESTPSSRIVMKLDMTRPFEGHNIVEFTFEPKGETTAVTWALHGPQPLLAKIVATLIDCEKMVGASFSEGLGNLKSLAEKS